VSRTDDLDTLLARNRQWAGSLSDSDPRYFARI
jgi:uncharacterized lipoprotein YmbA